MSLLDEIITPKEFLDLCRDFERICGINSFDEIEVLLKEINECETLSVSSAAS